MHHVFERQENRLISELKITYNLSLFKYLCKFERAKVLRKKRTDPCHPAESRFNLGQRGH